VLLACALAALGLAASLSRTSDAAAAAGSSFDSATASLVLDVYASPPRGGSGGRRFANVTSLGGRILSVYLAEAVDPVTYSNRGRIAALWVNPGCWPHGIGMCEQSAASWVEFSTGAQPTSPLAELSLRPGRYAALRLELCRGGKPLSTVRFQAEGMLEPHEFFAGTCAVTVALEPPLEVLPGARVHASIEVDLSELVTASDVGAALRGDVGCTQGSSPQFCMQMGESQLFTPSVEMEGGDAERPGGREPARD